MSEILVLGKVQKTLTLASVMTGFHSLSLLSNLKTFQVNTLKALQRKYEPLGSNNLSRRFQTVYLLVSETLF